MGMHPSGKTCEEIMTLLNELLEGGLSGDRAEEARKLIESHPECRAFYQTLNRTVELYKIRTNEVKKQDTPLINWSSIEQNTD